MSSRMFTIGLALFLIACFTVPFAISQETTGNLLEDSDVDRRLTFLMVRLADVESLLDAVENQIATTAKATNRKVAGARRAETANVQMDRKGGGPVRWQEFYGRLEGQPRLPQFDYIYRANERTRDRAVADASALGGRLDELTKRQDELENDQNSLWCDIAFRLVSRLDLDEKPVYNFEQTEHPNPEKSTDRAALRATAKFMRESLSLISRAEINQATAFSTVNKSISNARKQLNRDLLSVPNYVEGNAVIDRFSNLAKQLDDVANNLSDSYQVAQDGSQNNDSERKERFRALLQNSLVDYSILVIELDTVTDQLAQKAMFTPDLDRDFGVADAVETHNEPGEQTLKLAAPFNPETALSAQMAIAKGLGQEVIETNGVGIEMVLIPGGSFLMGTPPTELDRGENERLHSVEITRHFRISSTETTKAQFRQFAQETGYKTEGEKNPEGVWGYLRNPNGSYRWTADPKMNWRMPGFEQRDDEPVVAIAWRDSIEFCNWLSQKEELPNYYRIIGDRVVIAGGLGYRLPTESEWEFASRAGTESRLCSQTMDLYDQANIADHSLFDKIGFGKPANEQVGRDGFAETAPVKSFPQNPFGLYEVHGNVWEWCWDFYGEYPVENQIDPTGPPNGEKRIARGGGWNGYRKDCRSGDRGAGYLPSTRSVSMGFRVAKNAF